MRGLIFQEQDPPSNTVSPFWLSDYSEFYLDVDYAPHTLVTDIHKMSDWLPHKMCTQHQKYQKGQLIFLVECHKVGSTQLREEEHGTKMAIHYEVVIDSQTIKMLLAEYGKIGSNLNQIAKYFNTGGAYSKSITNEIQQCLYDLYRLKKELLKMIGDYRGNSETY